MKQSLPPTGAIVRVVLTIGAFAGLCYVLFLIREVIALVALAALLAIVLGPYVQVFERRRVPRPIAVLLVYLLLFAVIVAIGLLVVPPLVTQVELLANDIPRFIDQLASDETFKRYDREYHITESLKQQAESIPGELGSAASTLQDVTVGVFATLTQLLIVLTVTFLLLLNRDRMIDWGQERLGPERGPQARALADDVYHAISAFVIGNVFVSVINGIVAFGVLELLDVPFAVPLAVLMAFFNLIPVVGATIGAILVGLVTLFVDFPTATIVWLASQVIYQVIENRFIRPALYEGAISLHPLLGIGSVLLGLELLGLLGAIIAVPLAAALQVIARAWWRRRVGDEEPETAAEPASRPERSGPAPAQPSPS